VILCEPQAALHALRLQVVQCAHYGVVALLQQRGLELGPQRGRGLSLPYAVNTFVFRLLTNFWL
jgi:hypothetical protein